MHSPWPVIFYLAVECVVNATPASASNTPERSVHSRALLELLAGIDTAPTADDLRHAVAQPTSALLIVALDPKVPLYERRRAVNALGLFVTEHSAVALAMLATTWPTPELRWVAVATY